MMENNEKIWWVYSTFPNRDEALSTARNLLSEKLIACANIFENVTSLYHWEEGLNEETETILLAKTSATRVDDAVEAIKRLHPFSLPCIVALPLERGNPEFLRWVKEQAP